NVWVLVVETERNIPNAILILNVGVIGVVDRLNFGVEVARFAVCAADNAGAFGEVLVNFVFRLASLFLILIPILVFFIFVILLFVFIFIFHFIFILPTCAIEFYPV